MFELALAPLYGFALVLFRTAGLCSVAPLFGTRSVPARVRLAFSLALSFTLFLAAGSPSVALPLTFLDLAAGAASETAVGLVAGLSARLVLDAAQAAGQLAGLSMGLGYSAVMDPFNGVESTTLGQIFSTVALGAAVALGIHREAVLWICRSLQVLPPGSGVDMSHLLQGMVTHTLWVTALAVRLAFPLLAAGTLGHLALGLLGKAAPQLNLSNVGFSVAILGGGSALFVLAPTVAQLAASQAVAAFTQR